MLRASLIEGGWSSMLAQAGPAYNPCPSSCLLHIIWQTTISCRWYSLGIAANIHFKKALLPRYRITFYWNFSCSSWSGAALHQRSVVRVECLYAQAPLTGWVGINHCGHCLLTSSYHNAYWKKMAPFLLWKIFKLGVGINHSGLQLREGTAYLHLFSTVTMAQCIGRTWCFMLLFVDLVHLSLCFGKHY